MEELYCPDCYHWRPEDQEDCDHETCDDCRMSYRPDDNCECQYCEDCDQHYTNVCDCPVCDDCRNTFPQGDGFRGSMDLCESCLQHYFTCDGCDDLTHDENNYWCDACEQAFCGSCYEYDHEHSENVHDYSYKPSPIFHGIGPEYLGVELEVDDAHGDPEAVADLSNDEDLFYLKQDSSLTNGFELVTHPLTLAYHLKSFPWQEVVKEIKSQGYKSHDAGTCGLHVHVSREALGRNPEHQDFTLSKLIVLFWRHWDNLVTLSRREDSQLHQWSKPNHKHYDRSTILAHLPFCKSQIERYYAINNCNTDTIEFRMFRGTLNVNTIKATLQLVHVLLEMCRQWGISRILNSQWSDVVDASKEYAELTQYLKERKCA